MSLQKIRPEDLETFTIETNPYRTFSSSSSGASGLVYVFPRRSHSEKEVKPLTIYTGSFVDQDINDILRSAALVAKSSGSNEATITTYLNTVNSQQQSLRKQQQVEILRVIPGISLDSDMLSKRVIQNTLMPFYRTVVPTANYAYSNYNCLNFFTGSGIPENTVLLYANPITNSLGNITGPYLFSGSFSFDFYINPRYTTDSDTSEFKAGTILHLSSCYAVSLVTGSSVDINGKPDKYRILLQLSSSTDTNPSSVSLNSLPNFSFLSSDNSLARNTWHHVTIKWGTNSYNYGSGSFVIDDAEKGTFVIPSASVTPTSFSSYRSDPKVLCVGNYYEGMNSGSNSMVFFFSTDTAQREGLDELIADTGFAPVSYSFTHPLNAEIHDLKIYNRCLTTSEIASLRTNGPTSVDGLMFYLPPFFTYESPYRKFYGGFGGVPKTPFWIQDGSTTTPYNTDMAFGVGGHVNNLENYTREFVYGRYPRLWNLTGSIMSTTIAIPTETDVLLYSTGSFRKNALTILPCDNGSFYPNFSLFLSPLSSSRFKNDLGNFDYSLVSLKHIISTSSLFPGLLTEGTGSISGELSGPDPSVTSSLTTSPGTVPTVLQRTRDNSSNEVVIFDISNLYYGNRIKPNTFTICDTSLSCSGGKVRITLRDDGEGNLYRSDASGSNADWSTVGNVFYNEGMVLIKNPHLFFFGKEQFDMSFQGEQTTHVLTVNVSARPYLQVSSSNPSYLPISASDMANDTDKRFVYITGINIHDDNLNVISRTSLAQPIVCRTADKMLFKVRTDF
jgi:hypothetical protein